MSQKNETEENFRDADIETEVEVASKELEDLQSTCDQLQKSTQDLNNTILEKDNHLNRIKDRNKASILQQESELEKIKDDLNIKDQFKDEIQSIKETTDIIDKEVKDIENINNK